jgi:hypothetical protein
MKQFVFSMLLLFCLSNVWGQNIIAAEYFINHDPGVGLATPLSVGVPGTTVSFSSTVSTSALPPGFHTLSIRTKDATGVWGLYETRSFYITRAAEDVGEIVRAEFFIDNDPGAGAGTQISIGAAGNLVQFTLVLPTTSLAPGFHTLAIRTKNADGVWGLFETRAFYITSSSNDATPVAAAEYFFDTDPGPGNGMPLSIGASGNTVSFTSVVPTNSLSAGFHVLAVRTRDANGAWGLFETRAFYISSTSANMGAITEAEYFLDTDPGVGSGSPLTFTTPGNTATQTFIAQVPVGMSNGQHLLAIRAKDANGIWGLFEVHEFTVSGFPLPLEWASFTGRRADATVVLQWQTENENNTAHFVIERSHNGRDFTAMAGVEAKGRPHNTYDYRDNSPREGLNYYRIKQVDKDGAFKYSIIIKVYFGGREQTDLKLFPQPANTFLNVAFSGKGPTLFVEVYDANGKTVLAERRANSSLVTIDVRHFAGGMYWIVVSDGVNRQKGQFVKQ